MKLTRREFLKISGITAACYSLGSYLESITEAAGNSNQKKPNIILIMADDMGFFGYRLLWKRNQYAQYRQARRKRFSL